MENRNRTQKWCTRTGKLSCVSILSPPFQLFFATAMVVISHGGGWNRWQVKYLRGGASINNEEWKIVQRYDAPQWMRKSSSVSILLLPFPLLFPTTIVVISPGGEPNGRQVQYLRGGESMKKWTMEKDTRKKWPTGMGKEVVSNAVQKELEYI